MFRVQSSQQHNVLYTILSQCTYDKLCWAQKMVVHLKVFFKKKVTFQTDNEIYHILLAILPAITKNLYVFPTLWLSAGLITGNHVF